MALRDPVAAYNAANNLEAHHLCNLLAAAGIEAYLTEDVSQVGTWLGGLIPEIHKPQVWVERADAERARPILEEYERRAAARRAAASGGGTAGASVGVTCEACGRHSLFPESQRGSVQECPHCGEYVDVGEMNLPAPDAGEGEPDEPAG